MGEAFWLRLGVPVPWVGLERGSEGRSCRPPKLGLGSGLVGDRALNVMRCGRGAAHRNFVMGWVTAGAPRAMDGSLWHQLRSWPPGLGSRLAGPAVRKPWSRHIGRGFPLGRGTLGRQPVSLLTRAEERQGLWLVGDTLGA